jgi:hypothetical protein
VDSESERCAKERDMDSPVSSVPGARMGGRREVLRVGGRHGSGTRGRGKERIVFLMDNSCG